MIAYYRLCVHLFVVKSDSCLFGKGLVPQLKDPRTEREQPVISTSYYENHAIRTKDWRYIRYADGAEELYDHRRDPDEFTNLASDAKHQQIKQILAKWLPKNAAPEVKTLRRRHSER